MHTRSIIIFIACTLALAGCLSHSDGGGGPITYTLGGTVSGLNGSVVLENNGSNDLTVSSNGSFAFPTQTISSNFYSQVANSGTYSITIISQPAGQTCAVSNGSGTVSSGSNISNVSVTCSTNYYSISGTASGLNGAVVLQNNSGDNLTVSASGAFTFPTQLTDSSAYSVTVLTPPTGEICSVSSGVGTVSGGNVTTVMVVCSTNGYTIGGTVSGMNASTSLVLQDNNVDNLNVSANGAFTFATPVADTSPYSVSLFSKPSGQNCSITNGSGTLAGANVTDVAVACKNIIIAGCIQSPAFSLANPVPVSTFAGAAGLAPPGSTDTTSPTSMITASFRNPSGITTDGSNFYISDTGNNKIRMISSGSVSTLAGSGSAGSADNATGTSATFDNPNGITTDGTNLYVADTLNNKIRQIVIATGAVTTLAGSGSAGSADNTVGTSATFNHPSGITNDGNSLYVADTNNNKIRVISMATGAVSTLAGSGSTGNTNNTGTLATFNLPWGITTDGTNLYLADTYNHMIRKIVISSAVVTTLAGQGSAGYVDSASGTPKFDLPHSITINGTNLYVTDTANQLIRMVTSSGTVTTLAGTAGSSGSTDSTGTTASFYGPTGITTDGYHLYVTDTQNNKIRQVN